MSWQEVCFHYCRKGCFFGVNISVVFQGNIATFAGHFLIGLITGNMSHDEEMERRIERAAALFKEGYNCAQSVVAAFADQYGFTREQALRMSASFGGGIGRMRETCGAACGLFMLAGLETGVLDAADREGKAANYALVQRLAAEFRRRNGALRCADLLGLGAREPVVPVPEARTEGYYRKRPCPRVVEEAARIWVEYKQGRLPEEAAAL